MSDLSVSAISPVTALAGADAGADAPVAAPRTPLEALVGTPAGSLGDAMGHGVAAAGASPEAASTWAGAQVAGGGDALGDAPSLTLALMAQAGPRQDLLGGPPGASFEPGGADAGVPTSASGDSQVAPLQPELQATVAVASLLHLPAGTPGAARATGVEDPARHAVDLDPDEEEPPAGTAPDDEEALDEAPPSPRMAATSAGDAELYARLVAALRAAEREGDGLSLVLGELRRQRCALLVTPVSAFSGAECAAHVDLLWPRGAGGRALRLAGALRWPARPAAAWWTTHVVKSQADGHVRRLMPLPGSGAAEVAVVLGAQATPPRAASAVCLRVRESTRLWRAMEPQWSLRIAIGARPLLMAHREPGELVHGR